MADEGKQYAAYIEAQLAAEIDRRESANRGSATVFSASGLITIVLAVFAVLLPKDHPLTGGAKAFLGVALLALLGSAICAVVAGRPWRIALVRPDTLYSMVGERWHDPEDYAQQATAFANAEAIVSMRPGTTTKLNFLKYAGYCQIAAIAALAFSTLSILGISGLGISGFLLWPWRILKQVSCYWYDFPFNL
jgi:hypothetical protein